MRERLRLKRASALFVPVFAVTYSLTSFDWLMSLEPHWFSSIYGVYFLGSLALAALAVVAITLGS